MKTERGEWGSRIGFILAASGSAIGLGNIVFFSANAYTYGAGAFYVPYLIALLTAGIPVMILEFGLGRMTGRSFPLALGQVGGRVGEFAGWWAILNALIITMYYCAILGWVGGIWWEAVVGRLWQPSVAVPAFGFDEGALPNPVASFFSLISSWSNVGWVAVVWAINVAMAFWGTRSIERAVKVMMPLLWLFMIAMVLLGSTLDGALHGIYLLLTPNFAVLSDPRVWHGAFAQIFFTLSLGFGIMPAYASYLPKRADHVSNTLAVAGLNSLFELIAGMAVFSLLFAFSVTPKASTLSMMFFIVPQGIAQLGGGAQMIGALFFTLLLIAGLTSSVSLLEAGASALIDKFDISRRASVLSVAVFGMLGSVLFALPKVIDAGLNSNGTFGLTFLDLIDHYAFNYGLLVVGLVECILIGWFLPLQRLIDVVNEHAHYAVGRVFSFLVRYFAPAVLLFLIGFSAVNDITGGGLYGSDFTIDDPGLAWLPAGALAGWLALTVIGAAAATFVGRARSEDAR